MRWFIVLLLTAATAGGCAHQSDVLNKQVTELQRRLQEIERSNEAALASVAAPTTASTAPQAPGIPGGPPPQVATPDPGATPALPVVKLQPIKVDPFAGNKEPEIRIGRQGRLAAPASTRSREEPIDYEHVDEYGNLIDTDGKIVYRAGANSPPIDTIVDGVNEDDGYWDDPHESPADRVARALAVPEVDSLPDPIIEYGRDASPSRATAREARQGSPMVNMETRPAPQSPRVLAQEKILPPVIGTPVTRAPEPPINIPGAMSESVPAPETRDIVSQPTTERAVLALEHAEPSGAVVPAPVHMPRAPVVRVGSAPGRDGVQTQRKYRGKRERLVKRTYDRGMGFLNQRAYDKAARVFKTMLKRYSDHDLADNALYWLGETAYARGQWLQGLTWFQDLMVRYPQGNKLPDAMLKAAMCYANLGQTSYALQLLSEVESIFHTTAVADVARKKRMALTGGGH